MGPRHAYGSATGDPPWLGPAAETGEPDPRNVRGWREQQDAWHEAALRQVGLVLDPRAAAALPAGVSVVVRAQGEPADLTRCLRSVAAQAIDPDLIEVVVVADGRVDIDQVRPSTRVIQLHGNAGRWGYDIGAAAASRRFVTFVDGRDTLSPEFLAVLLADAAALTVPVTPDHDQATPYGALIPTRLARAVRYRRDLLRGETALEDLVFWASLASDPQVAIHMCSPEAGAAYHRSTRPAPSPTPVTTLDQAVRLLDVVVELERLATRAKPPISERLQARIDMAADQIGIYLRGHPSDRRAVVAALDRRPIFRYPHHRMNQGLGRGLVVAYAFPPYADASGIVMAKRIRARGQVVDVIYNAMDRHRKRDLTTRRIAGPYIGDEWPIATPTHYARWRSMEAFTLAGMERIQEWTKAKGHYEWLYSRAHFAASHILAATYKLSHLEVPWTAEFSDPLARGRLAEEQGTSINDGPVIRALRNGLRGLGLPVPGSTNSFVWCEEVAYALADELIFINENQLEYMLGYCANRELAETARKKAVIAPHPAPTAELYSTMDSDYQLDDGVANLAYFGVFYATRGLDDVFTAIARCDPQTRAKLRVHVFTTDPEPVRQHAAELGVEEAVGVGSYVGYLEFLNLTTRFDCLIVNDVATRDYLPVNPYLPSKWSDYRGSGTPVWGLVEDGSPLSRQPLQFVSPVGDIDAAADVLTRVVRAKLEGA